MSSENGGPLSRELVLEAALYLADRQGIESLSMRRLAAELSVKAMSLYNHVQNKEDILDGITDMVVAEIGVPDPGDHWKTAMRHRAMSAHEVLLRHEWSTMELLSRVNVGPAMLRYVDATIGCLLNAGFSLEAADHAWNAIDSHIYGFTLQELNFPFEAAEYRDAAQAYLPQLPAGTYPHIYRMTQHIIAGEYDGLHDFGFGLEIILDGLERMLTTHGRRKT